MLDLVKDRTRAEEHMATSRHELPPKDFSIKACRTCRPPQMASLNALRLRFENCPALVLAGGLGTRLRAVFNNGPKHIATSGRASLSGIPAALVAVRWNQRLNSVRRL